MITIVIYQKKRRERSRNQLTIMPAILTGVYGEYMYKYVILEKKESHIEWVKNPCFLVKGHLYVFCCQDVSAQESATTSNSTPAIPQTPSATEQATTTTSQIAEEGLLTNQSAAAVTPTSAAAPWTHMTVTRMCDHTGTPALRADHGRGLTSVQVTGTWLKNQITRTKRRDARTTCQTFSRRNMKPPVNRTITNL